MKKSFGIKQASVVAIVAALNFIASVALAHQGILEDIGVDYDGRIVVITGPGSVNTVSFCGREFTEYKAVVIGPSTIPRAIVTTIGINPGAVVKVGDRFDIQSPTQCGAGRISAILTRNRDRGQHRDRRGLSAAH